MEKKSGIYCIENIIDGKKYIGWAIDFDARFKRHAFNLKRGDHYSTYLQNAWNKYGEENFKFWIIAEYPRDETILKLMEIYFISYYNSFCKDGGGYNLTRGGQGTLGAVQTEETIKKRIEKLSHPSDETRELLRIRNIGKNNPNYGKSPSDKTRKLMSELNSGNKNNMYGKSGEKSPVYGTTHSDEWKKNMSEKLSGKNNPMFAKKSPNASSPYFGVMLAAKKYWVAYLKQHGKMVRIGTFKTELDAARAYDKYIFENNLPNPLNFPEEYNQNNTLDKIE